MVHPPRPPATVSVASRTVEKNPGPTRFRLVALVTAGTGVLSAVAAAGGVGPFTGLRIFTPHLVRSQIPAAPLDAQQLYPKPTPMVMTKVTDMYDLPAAAPPRPPQEAPEPLRKETEGSDKAHPSPAARPTPEAHPTPVAHSTPSPTPSPGPGGGGDE